MLKFNQILLARNPVNGVSSSWDLGVDHLSACVRTYSSACELMGKLFLECHLVEAASDVLGLQEELVYLKKNNQCNLPTNKIKPLIFCLIF